MFLIVCNLLYHSSLDGIVNIAFSNLIKRSNGKAALEIMILKEKRLI